MVYNKWLDSLEGHHAATQVYIALSHSRPTKFEIDKRLREAYNNYTERQGRKHAY